MKSIRLFLAAATLTWLAGTALRIDRHAAALAPVASIISTQAYAQDAPKVEVPRVDVDIHTKGDGVWYLNPLVLVIGGGVLLLIIIALAMGNRGGGTTIVKS